MPQLKAQGRVEGQVRNGTVNAPVVDQEVRLRSPQGGMQQVAATKTDSAGHFLFDGAEISPNSFYLVQCSFRGVDYNAPARFDPTGRASADLTVYDLTSAATSLEIQSLQVLARAQAGKLRVDRVFDVLNASRPPRAYRNPGGTFRFRLEIGSAEPHVAVIGLMDMPLPQPVEPGKSTGEFSIQYPLKPGLTRVVVSTERDYSSPSVALNEQVIYPVDRAELFVVPSNLSVEAPAFEQAGVDTAKDVQKFAAQDLPAETRLEVRLAGEPAPSAPGEAAPAETEVKIVPNSLSRVGLPLLACFLLVLFWALAVCVAREWTKVKENRGAHRAQKHLEAKLEGLVNSLADLDELFASGKIQEKKYWKARLELKARLAAALRKGPPTLLKSHAIR